MRLTKFIKEMPVIGTIGLFFYRFGVAFAYYIRPLRELVFWLFTSRETTNFTYDLTELNRRYLISLVAAVLERPYEQISSYVRELENDTALRTHIQTTTQISGEKRFADSQVRYGRRIGWYAITRAMKPRIVVESGVDKGLGGCVLTAALARNAEEGYPGYYYGIDINPKAGYLLSGKYKQCGELLYGDSLASLRQFDKAIDLFINDSDHSPGYENAEYQTIAPRLSSSSIIVGDNSHCTDELLEFALATKRRFVFFHESPAKHWYPGGGIGIAFRRLSERVPDELGPDGA